MSQPEMQPEGPPRNEPGPGSGSRGRDDRGRDDRGRDDDDRGRDDRGRAVRGRRGRGGDLTVAPFPLGDWGEPSDRLDEVYRWVEADALRTATWYLGDRVR
ncbi:SLATT domain-containing protein, partial [Streptomyces sp. NPDC001274]